MLWLVWKQVLKMMGCSGQFFCVCVCVCEITTTTRKGGGNQRFKPLHFLTGVQFLPWVPQTLAMPLKKGELSCELKAQWLDPLCAGILLPNFLVYMHNASSIISWQSYQFILNWLGCISTWLCNYKHSLEFVIYMYFISTTLLYKMPFFSLIFWSWKHKTYWVNTNFVFNLWNPHQNMENNVII